MRWCGNEDQRAQAVARPGCGGRGRDLLELDSMHRVIAGCETIYFGMSVSDAYLAATVNAAAVKSGLSGWRCSHSTDLSIDLGDREEGRA